ncbi:MAG: hypothetical protein ACE5HT_16290 [Gemmatimonadales bacterium]
MTRSTAIALVVSLLGLTAASQPHPTVTVLGRGQLSLVAANDFSDPGFHQIVSARFTIPTGMPSTRGKRLTLRLSDATRPHVTCAREHPMSGCATVDWSDFQSRPHVPRGGVFANVLHTELETGPKDFYLSESMVLANVPDRYKPG